MGKVRPFCLSGLEVNILRPYCGLVWIFIIIWFAISLSFSYKPHMQTYRNLWIYLETMTDCLLDDPVPIFRLSIKSPILVNVLIAKFPEGWSFQSLVSGLQYPFYFLTSPSFRHVRICEFTWSFQSLVSSFFCQNSLICLFKAPF